MAQDLLLACYALSPLDGMVGKKETPKKGVLEATRLWLASDMGVSVAT
jgi:hypothetical protein